MQPNYNKKPMKISPFLVFFLIHSVQVGVGILGFQRQIAKYAGYDGWIAVILSGISIHIIIGIMYFLLNKSEGDLFSIHRFIFGKWVGSALVILWMIYFSTLAITVLRSYIEVVQVWMFPNISVFWFGFVFLLLVYYIVSGGFKSVVGISFLGVVIPLYLIFTLVFPLGFADYRSLLPVWTHSIKDMVLATKNMTFSYLGFMTLLVYYPFIKEPQKSQRWAHAGLLFTIILYLVVILISFTYYSEGQLAKTVWATLTLWKITELPFVARFEYIGITSWILVILPNACLLFWAASRLLKQTFRWNQHISLIGLLTLTLIVNCFLTGEEESKFLSDLVSETGFYLVYLYIPFLTFLYLIFHKVMKKP